MLFDIDSTFFIHLVFFLLLMAGLNRLMFSPFLSLQQARKTATEGRVRKSQKAMEVLCKQKAGLEAELLSYTRQMHAKRQLERERTVAEAEGMKREADREAERDLAENDRILACEAEKVTRQLAAKVEFFSGKLEERMLDPEGGTHGRAS